MWTQVYTDFSELQESLRDGTSSECCFKDHSTTTVNVEFESRGDTLSDVQTLFVSLTAVCSVIYSPRICFLCFFFLFCVASWIFWHLCFCLGFLSGLQDGKEFHIFFVNCFFRHARRVICEVNRKFQPFVILHCESYTALV